MTVVVEQNAFLFGVSAQRRAQFFHFFGGGVEGLFVAGAGLPPLVLRLQVLPDFLYGFGGGQGEGIWNVTRLDELGGGAGLTYPALEAGAGLRFEHVGGVHAYV